MKKMYSTSWQARLRFLVLTFLGLAIALVINFPFWAIAQTPSSNKASDKVDGAIERSSTRSAAQSSDQSINLLNNQLNQQPSNQLNIRPTNNNELRGVWLTNVDSEVLFSTERLQQAIKRLKRLKFNTLYPTVWNGGYTLYPSKVAEKYFGAEIDPSPNLKDRDMLAEAIQFGHEQKFTVIPWFEYGLMTEENSDLMRQHPEWITNRRNGSKVFIHGEKEQHRLVWLNPAIPEVQKFLTELVVEVVKKYDVDGIQLDDHFGMPVELGYDDYTIALYKKQHFGKLPPDDFNDSDWVNWRSRHLTDLMKKIHKAVKTIKPNCLISLSPNPKEFSYRKYLQDWYGWVYLGLIDELIVQLYRDDIDNFKAELERPEWQEVRLKIPVGVGILTGLRVQNVDMRQIKGQVKMLREMTFDGFSFFFYETLGNRDASFASLMYTPAERPIVQRFAMN